MVTPLEADAPRWRRHSMVTQPIGALAHRPHEGLIPTSTGGERADQGFFELRSALGGAAEFQLGLQQYVGYPSLVSGHI